MLVSVYINDNKISDILSGMVGYYYRDENGILGFNRLTKHWSIFGDEAILLWPPW